MPLYHYACRKCKHEVEVLQSIQELADGIDTPTKCLSNARTPCTGEYERIMGCAAIGLCDTHMLRDALGSRAELDRKGDRDRSDLYARKAKEAGVSTTGKWYHPGLALEVGDPMAWVGSISDIKEVCKQRGWNTKYEDGEIKIEMPADLGLTPKEQFGAKKQ